MLSTLATTLQTRKTAHKPTISMKISKMIDKNKSCCKMVTGMSRYSGPDPQTLPLPPELVMRTLSFLNEPRDKQNARLVCKGFATAGLYSLTSTAYFSTRLIEMAHSSRPAYYSGPILEMALHPVVSKYITKIVCNGTWLPTTYLSFEDFCNRREEPAKNKKQWPVREAHSLHVLRYQQEPWIISKEEDQKIFRTALEHFLKLKCILFTDIAADEHCQDLPRTSWPLILHEREWEDLWGKSSPYHNFAMCIRSLSSMAIKLDELSIEGKQNGISHRIFSHASPSDYSHLLKVFAHLRKIIMHVNTSNDTCRLDFAGLGRLLTHATTLQSLDLKGTGGLRKSRVMLSRLFKTFTWPHLKHFGLHGFSMHTDAELIAFFDRHRATLKSVALKTIFLHEKPFDDPNISPCEAWKHLFGELRKRSITFQNLVLFQIYDCRNSERDDMDLAARGKHGEKVLDFLRNGGLNPLAVDEVIVTADEVGLIMGTVSERSESEDEEEERGLTM